MSVPPSTDAQLEGQGHPGALLKERIRNLEIPGLVLRTIPE